MSDVPSASISVHVPGQINRLSLEVTDPCPDPPTLTVSTGLSARLIVAAVSVLMITAHVLALPWQPGKPQLET